MIKKKFSELPIGTEYTHENKYWWVKLNNRERENARGVRDNTLTMGVSWTHHDSSCLIEEDEEVVP